MELTNKIVFLQNNKIQKNPRKLRVLKSQNFTQIVKFIIDWGILRKKIICRAAKNRSKASAQKLTLGFVNIRRHAILGTPPKCTWALQNNILISYFTIFPTLLFPDHLTPYENSPKTRNLSHSAHFCKLLLGFFIQFCFLFQAPMKIIKVFLLLNTIFNISECLLPFPRGSSNGVNNFQQFLLSSKSVKFEKVTFINFRKNIHQWVFALAKNHVARFAVSTKLFCFDVVVVITVFDEIVCWGRSEINFYSDLIDFIWTR